MSPRGREEGPVLAREVVVVGSLISVVSDIKRCGKGYVYPLNYFGAFVRD